MSATESIDLSRAPLLSHLIELRRRLLLCLLVFGVAFACCYFVVEHIYQFLMQPLVNVLGDDSG
jgi:sec-independent protein translocase protein TatC